MEPWSRRTEILRKEIPLLQRCLEAWNRLTEAEKPEDNIPADQGRDAGSGTGVPEACLRADENIL